MKADCAAQFAPLRRESSEFNEKIEVVFSAQTPEEIMVAMDGLCEEDRIAIWSGVGAQNVDLDAPPSSYLEAIIRMHPAKAAYRLARDFGREVCVWWFVGKSTVWSRAGSNRAMRAIASSARKYVLEVKKEKALR
jgi:hypothetical protein